MDDRCDKCGDKLEYGLIAVKRKWVPQWLWGMFKWVIPHQPFKWIFTTPCE